MLITWKGEFAAGEEKKYTVIQNWETKCQSRGGKQPIILLNTSRRLKAQTDKQAAQFMVKLDKPMDRQSTKYKKMQQNNLHGCILTRWKKKKPQTRKVVG